MTTGGISDSAAAFPGFSGEFQEMVWRSAAAAAAAFVLSCAGAANAAIMQASYFGTVDAGAFDPGSIFGPTLSGSAFVVTYNYDTSLGGVDNAGGLLAISGGSSQAGPPPPVDPAFLTSPMINATITINGVTETFGGQFYGVASLFSPINRISHSAVDSSNIGLPGAFVDTRIFPIALIPSSLTASFSSAGGGNGDFQLYDLATDTVLASANLTVSSITIIGPDGVPEPASWAMMIGGIGLAGTALRRQRRAVPA